MDKEKMELIACLSCAREYYNKADQFAKVLQEKYPDKGKTGPLHWSIWDWIIEGFEEKDIDEALNELNKN